MSLKAVGNKLIIREIKPKKEQNGILIPEAVNRKSNELKAEVISVGEGKWLENGSLGIIRVKEGDVIAFNHFSGTKLTYNGIEYTLITEEDILAKIIDEKEKI